jgi:hypothetical protein
VKIYIAGPMTGRPQFNYPMFHQVAAELRAAGHIVINPAENPVPPCGSWLGYMRMSVAQVAAVDCLVILPGWARSRGARIEFMLAWLLGFAIYPLRKAAAIPSAEVGKARAARTGWRQTGLTALNGKAPKNDEGPPASATDRADLADAAGRAQARAGE